MNSYYWYLILDKRYKFVYVAKEKGLIFDKYNFVHEVSDKMKKIIKKTLKYCPSNCLYKFAYIECDNCPSIVKCVGVDMYEEVGCTEIWKSLPAEKFFKFCEENTLHVPEHHYGMFVFSTLKENLDNGTLVQDGYLYKVVANGSYVYPLKALG